MWKALVVLTAVAALLPACGGDDGSSEGCADLTDEEPGFTITITNRAFHPACFTATASQGISVVNEDEVDHTFTMVGSQINLPIAAGEIYNGPDPISGAVEPGTYGFVCMIHPQMTGDATIIE
jgi:plastocyanin